ncbi:hypothetical protein AK812_SmicGene27504 [Symbiodinium microadriaticum]|uniref:Uncharacterized protein n=1 Tax=Symbiodinium microadriaticum TaxID=2951 RepID=A0A1Q9D6S4_SYMMI|nr:hypothetical protein AK812_SmicGene27504 [Symbiodinium microadriaticum]
MGSSLNEGGSAGKPTHRNCFVHELMGLQLQLLSALAMPPYCQAGAGWIPARENPRAAQNQATSMPLAQK